MTLAGLGLAQPPGQLEIAGWIEMWGASALFGRPLTVREAARLTVLMRIYKRFLTYHLDLCAAVRSGHSAGVTLFDWHSSGRISQGDFDLIQELIVSKVYKPKG